MEDAAIEGPEAFELRDMRRREMAGRNHDIVELLGLDMVVDEIVGGDAELARVLIIGDVAHRRAEADPVAQAGPLDATLDIVPQHGARRIEPIGPPKCSSKL